MGVLFIVVFIIAFFIFYLKSRMRGGNKNLEVPKMEKKKNGKFKVIAIFTLIVGIGIIIVQGKPNFKLPTFFINFRVKNLNDLERKICSNIDSQRALLHGVTEESLVSIRTNYSEISEDMVMNMFININSHWETSKKENIPRKIDKWLNSTVRESSVNNDRNELVTIGTLLNYYDEQSNDSLFIFEYIAQSLLGVNSLIVPPLEMKSVMIDGVPYEKNSIEILHMFIEKMVDYYYKNFSTSIIAEGNKIYDQYLNNIDNYLDWFYSFESSIIKSGYAISDIVSSVFSIQQDDEVTKYQNYMIENYIDHIGYSVSFNKMSNVFSSWRNSLIDLSILSSLLMEQIQIDSEFNTIEYEKVGNEFMLPLTKISDMIECILSDAIPFLTMGQRIDKDGIMAIDTADTIINFIPGVGFLAGLVVDAVAQKATEYFQRDEFKQEIKQSILQSKNDYNTKLAVILSKR